MCDVLVEISKGFDKEEKQLPENERMALSESLNGLVDTAKKEEWPRMLFRRHDVSFPEGVRKEDSSLYMYKATKNYNVILSYDDDAVYHQKVISLYRVIKQKESTSAFNETAHLLYSR